MSAPKLKRRKPTALPPPIVDDEGITFTATPVQPMTARSTFLLTMAVTSFAAFTLFALAELTHHHPHFLLADVLQGDTHAVAQWALLLAVPATSAAAWFPISISSSPSGVLRIKSSVPPPSPDSPAHSSLSPTSSLLAKMARRYRRNHMFAIYQSVGWTLYALFVTLQLVCFGCDTVCDLPFCRPGSRSVQAVAAFIAEVLIISSVLTLEKRRDRNRQRRKDRFVVQLNNFNNMLLLVGATLLALASEYTRVFPHPSGSSVGYPMATGLGSLALFVTALFNTYSLGGVLSTKDGWNFYQPFMGGARFVLFQIVSWTCFGAGAALQVLYLLSLVVVDLELFVGVMTVAGSLFVIAEIGMMMSLLVFKNSPLMPKKASDEDLANTDTPFSSSKAATDGVSKSVVSSSDVGASGLYESLRSLAEECFGVLVVGALMNNYVIPNVLMVVTFAVTTNLSASDVAYYGFASWVVELIMAMSRTVTTHLYLQDSCNGLRPDVSRYDVKYMLPQVIASCLPALATYQHYIYDKEAFVPVLLITVVAYSYELTYVGSPEQFGGRERASWIFGHSFLMETIKRYFSGTIIRMAPLDPKKQYMLSFHPHGISPVSVVWLQFNAQWRKLFPNFYAHTLTATIMHHMPFSRDLLQFLGSREVTRKVISYTLQQKESVLLVPGGQAEMLHQQSAKKEVRVFTHHKGFIRLAIENGVPLVPVLSFNEAEMMDNVQAPMLQRWFVKKLTVPFPFFPYGRAMLPIPRKVHIPIVVGEPMEVPHIEKPTQDDIDKVHAKYFSVLKSVFDKYKDEVGCGDYKLVFI